MNMQCTVVECRMEIAELEKKKLKASLSFGEAVFTFSFPQVIELHAFVCYNIYCYLEYDFPEPGQVSMQNHLPGREI